MSWEAKAKARHQLESSLSESRDSDGDRVSPVVDGSGPMQKCRWRSLNPNRCVYPSGPIKRGSDSKQYLPSSIICDEVYLVWYAESR
jgi:hypothetical protein